MKWGASGSDGPPMTAPAQGYVPGGLADFRDASITSGVVGADVIGVTVHARELTAQATVTDRRFVAWWPGPSFDLDAKGGPKDFLVYDLTLRDGTVIRNVQPPR